VTVPGGRILAEIRERIRKREYVVTIHAADEMDDDGLTIFDLESIILTSTITERQKDTSTADWKYLILGDTVNGQPATVVVRLGMTGKAVIITVYRESIT
jgi:hypothetical protein